MPATSREPSGRIASRSKFKPAALVDERGCRRDIRSNGRTVIRQRSRFSEKPARQKNAIFNYWRSSLGADFLSPQSYRLLQVRFGPDVFADALVPSRACRPGIFPKLLTSQIGNRRPEPRHAAACAL